MVADTPVLKGPRLTLPRADFEQWCALRHHRLSRETLKFDHPDRPIPTEVEERDWWQEAVASGQHHIWAMVLDGPNTTGIVGFINVFEITEDTCETGVVVFPASNYGNGYATEAYRALLPHLSVQLALPRTHILTHPQNQAAIRVYEKLGFERDGGVRDGELTWLRMSYLWR